MPGHITQTVLRYDEALQKVDSEKLKLAIQLSLDGFSFCTFNESHNKFLSIESHTLHNVKNIKDFYNLFNDFVQNHPWLNLSYESINILFESQKTTLIPTPLYDYNEQENYAKLNFTFSDDQIIQTDRLVNVDAVQLYVLPKKVYHLLNVLFPAYGLSCQASVLIESLLVSNKNQSAHKRCYVNARNSYLDIVIIEGSKLLYYNAFSYKTKEDFIYYLIFVLDQLKLNPEEIELVLSGNMDKNSKLFEMVYKYVRNITFTQSNDVFNYSYIFNDIPAHQFANLLNFYQCEL